MSLAADILACTRCPLHEKQETFKDGSVGRPVPPAVGSHYKRGGIAVVCEAPGFWEAKEGQPLVGKAGQMFNQLAHKAGLERSSLLLTHSVRCRPPNNRVADYPEAIHACAHWTTEEFTWYTPAVVVLMGRVAIRQVFGAEATVGATRGTLDTTPPKHPWGSRTCICTYHPAAAVYGGGENSDAARFIVQDLMAARVAWQDLQAYDREAQARAALAAMGEH